jgi:hypothetical protein
MGKVEIFRTLSHVSAALLGAHIALLAIYYSIGIAIGIIAPQFVTTLGNILFVSGFITLATFCLSTQFHHALRNENEDN